MICLLIFFLSDVIEVPRAPIKRDLYIAVSDNIESRIIQSELSRVWSKSSKEGVKYDKIKSRIRFKIIFVKFNRLDEYQLDKYPQYKYGKYGQWTKFNNKTFQCVSWPLQTIYVLDNNFNLDEDEEIYNNFVGEKMNHYWNNEFTKRQIHEWLHKGDYKYQPRPKFSPKPSLLKFPWE